MAVAWAGIYFNGAYLLVPCAAAWALSVWWYGRVIDRTG